MRASINVTEHEQLIRHGYEAFNAREIETALAGMHPDVDWPNAWEGGRVVGRAAVRDYRSRQFSAISSIVEPESFTPEPDGSMTVEVHQVVRDAHTGELLWAALTDGGPPTIWTNRSRCRGSTFEG